MTRILSAAVLVALVFAVTRYLPAPFFLAMVCLLTVLGVWEFTRLTGRRGFDPQLWAGAVAAVLLVFALYRPDTGLSAAAAAVVVGLPLLELLRKGEADMRFVNLTLTLFAGLFFGVLFGHVAALRGLPGEDGRDLPFLLLLLVAAADTGAYYGGRAFGRRRLAPSLSPGKTVEGFLAGMVSAAAAALVARAWFIYRLSLRDALVLAVLLTVVSAAGDLVESMMKRWAGAKDSSGLIPGHGGLLDRIDGLLFAAPVLFYYHQRFMSDLTG